MDDSAEHPRRVALELRELAADPENQSFMVKERTCIEGLIGLLAAPGDDIALIALQAVLFLCSHPSNTKSLIAMPQLTANLKTVSKRPNEDIRGVCAQIVERLSLPIKVGLSSSAASRDRERADGSGGGRGAQADSGSSGAGRSRRKRRGRRSGGKGGGRRRDAAGAAGGRGADSPASPGAAYPDLSAKTDAGGAGDLDAGSASYPAEAGSGSSGSHRGAAAAAAASPAARRRPDVSPINVAAAEGMDDDDTAPQYLSGSLHVATPSSAPRAVIRHTEPMGEEAFRARFLVTLVFEVPEMETNYDQSRLRTALVGVEGVISVTVMFRQHEIVIYCLKDDCTSGFVDELLACIQGLGFDEVRLQSRDGFDEDDEDDDELARSHSAPDYLPETPEAQRNQRALTSYGSAWENSLEARLQKVRSRNKELLERRETLLSKISGSAKSVFGWIWN